MNGDFGIVEGSTTGMRVPGAQHDLEAPGTRNAQKGDRDRAIDAARKILSFHAADSDAALVAREFLRSLGLS